MPTPADLGRWAFSSPRRLVALLLVPLVAWAALNLVLGGGDEGGDRTAAPTDGSTAGAGTDATDGTDAGAATDGGTEHAATRTLPAEVDTVVRGFLDAWLSRTLPADAWYAGVVPHVTPQLAEGLRSTDPARVPAAAVVDVEPTTVGDYAAVVDVDLDDGSGLAVEVVFDGGAWLVSALTARP